MKATEVPFISIVIPTLNASAVLTRCLESVARQDFRDFEVVVCDAVSSDCTLEVAQRWKRDLPRLTIDSRHDGGIYQGINRGIQLTAGRWILVLGADDQLASPTALATMALALQQTNVRFVYGDVRIESASQLGPAGSRYPGPLTAAKLYSKNICQQSIFYRRDLFVDHGLFRSEYRICADWDIALRVCAREDTVWVDLVVADYAATGASARTPDTLFYRDRPLMLAILVLTRPLDKRFVDARHALLGAAGKPLNGSMLALKTAVVWLAARWLAVLARTGASNGSKPA